MELLAFSQSKLVSAIRKSVLCYADSALPLHVTIYQNHSRKVRASILYFHGGGLLYGSREDLPALHISRLCQEGYVIFAFDYRLAPVTKLPSILLDVEQAIAWYLQQRESLVGKDCPYFLWGRSAGAYLALLAASVCSMAEVPAGILSYYGYAFLQPSWYQTPSSYYSLFPSISRQTANQLAGTEETAEGSLDTRYGLYVYARQTGRWPSLIGCRSQNMFYRLHKEANYSNYPPVFLTHSLLDTDVPFEESNALHQMLPQSELYLVTVKGHDYDKNTALPETNALLNRTLHFLANTI